MGVFSLSKPTRPPSPRSNTAQFFRRVLSTFLCILSQVAGQTIRNITFQNTSPELSFSPPVCSVESGTVGEPIPESCKGTWTTVDLQGSSNGSVTSTEGPTATFNDLLPQVFFTFEGLALFVKTSTASNATGNLTVLSRPSGNVQSIQFNPSLDFWAVHNLDEAQTTTVALSFVPDASGAVTRLDIDFLKIAISSSSNASTFLSTPAPTSTLFTPTIGFPSTVNSTIATSTEHNLRQPTSTIIGETLSIFFGLLVLGLIILFGRQWRLQRRHEEEGRQRSMQVQAASQILPSSGGDRHPSPALRLSGGGTFDTYRPARDSGAANIQPSIIPFPAGTLSISSHRSDPTPRTGRVRARERSSSAFTMPTGGASSAMAEDGHSGNGFSRPREAPALT